MTFRIKTPEEKAALWCPYNDCIDCENPHCASCGWNPKVADVRIEKIKLSPSFRLAAQICAMNEELRKTRAENYRLKRKLGERV